MGMKQHHKVKLISWRIDRASIVPGGEAIEVRASHTMSKGLWQPQVLEGEDMLCRVTSMIPEGKVCVCVHACVCVHCSETHVGLDFFFS